MNKAMDCLKVREISENIRRSILKDIELSKDLDDLNSTIPIPKIGSGKIKLIILGQDPTVQNENSRKKINTVLNLDKKNGSLYSYINIIVNYLGLNIEENVYATNLIKCFFKKPPAAENQIISNHLPYWRELLQSEIDNFHDALIISLGQPVISNIITNGSREVKYYWGYEKGNFMNKENLSFISEDSNILKRRIFPFPHQPSLRKIFYRDNLKYYTDYVRQYIH